VFCMASSYNRPKLEIHVVKCAPRTVLDFHVGGLIYSLTYSVHLHGHYSRVSKCVQFNPISDTVRVVFGLKASVSI